MDGWMDWDLLEDIDSVGSGRKSGRIWNLEPARCANEFFRFC